MGRIQDLKELVTPFWNKIKNIETLNIQTEETILTLFINDGNLYVMDSYNTEVMIDFTLFINYLMYKGSSITNTILNPNNFTIFITDILNFANNE